jgi:hypothetical protein
MPTRVSWIPFVESLGVAGVLDGERDVSGGGLLVHDVHGVSTVFDNPQSFPREVEVCVRRHLAKEFQHVHSVLGHRGHLSHRDC